MNRVFFGNSYISPLSVELNFAPWYASQNFFGGHAMKNVLVALAFLSTPVFATDVIYEGDCMVNTVASNGADIRILAIQHVTLADGESVILLQRKGLIYRASASNLEGVPGQRILELDIFKAGNKAVIASGSTGYTGIGPSTFHVYGINKIELSCMVPLHK